MKLIVKYAVIKEDLEEMFVVMQDGGVASCYTNGEHLITEYYGERLTKKSKFLSDPDGSIWDELGEGKMYSHDWDGSGEDNPEKQEWDEEVIMDMVTWLYMTSSGEVEYERIELDWNDTQAIKDFLTEAEEE